MELRSKLLTIILISIVINVSGQNDSPITYDYYKNEIKKATTIRNIGRGLVIAGPILVASTFGVGLAMYAKGVDDNVGIPVLYGLLSASILVELVGIPLWIAGGTKRTKLRREMETTYPGIKLSFGPTRYGVGLSFVF